MPMDSLRSLHQDIEFDIPPHWHILTVAAAGDTTPRAVPETSMRQALAAPIGAPMLNPIVVLADVLVQEHLY
jgi:hypothetical protein